MNSGIRGDSTEPKKKENVLLPLSFTLFLPLAFPFPPTFPFPCSPNPSDSQEAVTLDRLVQGSHHRAGSFPCYKGNRDENLCPKRPRARTSDSEVKMMPK